MGSDWWKEGIVDCSDTVARENCHLQCSFLPDTLPQSGVGKEAGALLILPTAMEVWRFVASHATPRCVCVGMQAPKTAFFMPGKENILPFPQGCSYDFRSSCLGIIVQPWVYQFSCLKVPLAYIIARHRITRYSKLHPKLSCMQSSQVVNETLLLASLKQLG